MLAELKPTTFITAVIGIKVRILKQNPSMCLK